MLNRVLVEPGPRETPLWNGCKSFDESNVSGSVVVKEMQATPESNNIGINKTTYWVRLRAALNNSGVAVSPQNPGGASLHSHIEKKIA